MFIGLKKHNRMEFFDNWVSIKIYWEILFLIPIELYMEELIADIDHSYAFVIRFL